MIDLWPDLVFDVDIVTPVGILKEQAALLGPKTNNVVQAGVRSVYIENDFSFRFDLYCLALDYRYALFTISYPVELFPVTLVFNDVNAKKDSVIETETAFRDSLRIIFASEKTRKVIDALMVMATGQSEESE